MLLGKVDCARLGDSQVFGHRQEHIEAELIIMLHQVHKCLTANTIHHSRFQRTGTRRMRIAHYRAAIAKHIIGLEQTDNLCALTYALLRQSHRTRQHHHDVRRRVTLLVDHLVFTVSANLRIVINIRFLLWRERAPQMGIQLP